MIGEQSCLEEAIKYFEKLDIDERVTYLLKLLALLDKQSPSSDLQD